MAAAIRPAGSSAVGVRSRVSLTRFVAVWGAIMHLGSPGLQHLSRPLLSLQDLAVPIDDVELAVLCADRPSSRRPAGMVPLHALGTASCGTEVMSHVF